jgi:hypothetical protein
MAEMPAQGSLRSDPEEGLLRKRAGAHSFLQTERIHEVGGEAPGRTLGGIILNGPMTLLS